MAAALPWVPLERAELDRVEQASVRCDSTSREGHRHRIRTRHAPDPTDPPHSFAPSTPALRFGDRPPRGRDGCSITLQQCQMSFGVLDYRVLGVSTARGSLRVRVSGAVWLGCLVSDCHWLDLKLMTMPDANLHVYNPCRVCVI